MEAYKTANERFLEQLREQTDVALQLSVDAGDLARTAPFGRSTQAVFRVGSGRCHAQSHL